LTYCDDRWRWQGGNDSKGHDGKGTTARERLSTDDPTENAASEQLGAQKLESQNRETKKQDYRKQWKTDETGHVDASRNFHNAPQAFSRLNLKYDSAKVYYAYIMINVSEPMYAKAR